MSESLDHKKQQSEIQTQAENRFTAMVSIAICVFVLYISLGIPVSNVWNVLRIRDLELNGLAMTAQVGQQHECPAKRGKVICHDVTYQIKGKTYQQRNSRKDLKQNQQIQIIYAPIDPSFYRFADLPKPAPWQEGLMQRFVIVGFISVIFLSAGIAVLKKQIQVLKSFKE